LRTVRRDPFLTVLGWHRIGDAPDGLTTTPDAFLRHLDVLEAWGARVLPLPEALRLLRERALPRRAVVLTFDDGYASVVEQAWPALLDRGWPATLYAVSGFLDPARRLPWDHDHPDAELVRLMSATQLVEAASSGLHVGSHTHTHPWLPRRGARDLDEELRRSRALLEDLLDTPIDSLAYPAGGWNRAVRAATERAGYASGVTVDRGTNSARVDHLTLRRAFVPEEPEDLELILDGAYTWLHPLDAWRGRHGAEQLA
jgi:peptidoglycan/xylan/chitin deacetylase (PgdA/CDA1 family)